MESAPTASHGLIYRHRLPVRIMHWVNVVCLTILLMSGLQIFNAHPALYWSHDSRDSTRVLQITQKEVDGQWRGVTRIGGAEFDTHGVLGTSRSGDGDEYTSRAFPSWATI
ncbi:MAG: cytochrome b/b6 domain-containing protein, partial [Variovorax sp.]